MCVGSQPTQFKNLNLFKHLEILILIKKIVLFYLLYGCSLELVTLTCAQTEKNGKNVTDLKKKKFKLGA